jgi:hypothetical protein
MKKGLIYLGLFFWLLFFENFADAKAFHVDSTYSNSLLNDIKPISETSNLNKNRITNHLSIGIMKGFLMPHHEDMQQMYAHIQGLQLQYLSTDLTWENNKKFKNGNIKYAQRLGFVVSAIDLGTTISGKSYSGGLLVSSDLISNQGNEINWRSSLKFALGLGYLTQRYDAITNPENRAIGSHINGYMQLGLSIEKNVYKNSVIFLEFGLAHFSNACWKFPNLGVNLPYLQVGIGHPLNIYPSIKKSEKQRQLNQQLSLLPWRKSIAVRLGKKEIDLDDNRVFITGVMEFALENWISKRSNFRYAISYLHDRTYQFKKFDKMPNYNFAGTSEITVSAGYETRFGRWGVITDFGIYLYKPDFKKKTAYYEGIGCSYAINSNYKAVVRLKANKTIADFAEFGLTYLFN